MNFYKEFEDLIRKHKLPYRKVCEITEGAIYDVYGFDSETSPYDESEEEEELTEVEKKADVAIESLMKTVDWQPKCLEAASHGPFDFKYNNGPYFVAWNREAENYIALKTDEDCTVFDATSFEETSDNVQDLMSFIDELAEQHKD